MLMKYLKVILPKWFGFVDLFASIKKQDLIITKQILKVLSHYHNQIGPGHVYSTGKLGQCNQPSNYIIF